MMLPFMGCCGDDLGPLGPRIPSYSVVPASSTYYTAHTVPLPTGAAPGDLLLMFIGWGAATDATLAGWTEIVGAGANYFHCFYRVATGAEGATAAVTSADAVRAKFVVLRISGASATTPVKTSSWGTFSAVAHGTEAAPSVTSTIDNTLLINCSWGVNGNFTQAADNGVTEVEDSASAGYSSMVAYKKLPVPVASGVTTFTYSANQAYTTTLSLIVGAD